MTWICSVGLAVTLVVSLSPRPQAPTTETWTGWFSDKTCARVTDDDAASERNRLRQEMPLRGRSTGVHQRTGQGRLRSARPSDVPKTMWATTWK